MLNRFLPCCVTSAAARDWTTGDRSLRLDLASHVVGVNNVFLGSTSVEFGVSLGCIIEGDELNVDSIGDLDLNHVFQFN